MLIKTYEGTVAPEDISQKHLVTNHLLDPSKNIDKVIMYAETRHLMTFLTSGARSSKYAFKGYYPSTDGKTVKNIVPPVPKGEKLDDNAWQWRVMGRIQKESLVIGNAAVGTSQAGTDKTGGVFRLTLADDYLKNQMNALFPGGQVARVLGEPKRQGPQKFLYTFNTFAGQSFDWDTWMLPMAGRKTIFGAYTTVGERSRRGYGNFHFPDKYIQHATKQRKSFSISGDAATNRVVWYSLAGEEGFSYEAEIQLRAQMMIEDEYQKKHGRSTMRNEYGELLAMPSQYDENGEPIIAGDGAITQVEGSNDFEASGVDGLPTWEDLEDAVKAIKKKRNYEVSEPIVAKTGDDGMQHILHLAEQRAKDLGVRFIVKGTGEGQVLGYRFKMLDIAGEDVIFVEDPMQSDEKRYPARLQTSTGIKGLEASTIYFLDFSKNAKGRKNIEIRAFGRAGIDRSLFYSWFVGFVGRTDVQPQNPVDAEEFHIMKHDAIGVYDTSRCAIIYPNKTMAG